MKRLILGFCLGLVVILSISATYNTEKEIIGNKVIYAGKGVGKYILFTGMYMFRDSRGKEWEEKAMFKVDTTTGKTWIFRNGYRNNNSSTYYCKWQEIDN